jgi:hypothetical protein
VDKRKIIDSQEKRFKTTGIDAEEIFIKTFR